MPLVFSNNLSAPVRSCYLDFGKKSEYYIEQIIFLNKKDFMDHKKDLLLTMYGNLVTEKHMQKRDAMIQLPEAQKQVPETFQVFTLTKELYNITIESHMNKIFASIHKPSLGTMQLQDLGKNIKHKSINLILNNNDKELYLVIRKTNGTKIEILLHTFRHGSKNQNFTQKFFKDGKATDRNIARMFDHINIIGPLRGVVAKDISKSEACLRYQGEITISEITGENLKNKLIQQLNALENKNGQ
jgi:hypothetical protein